ncbi:MAG: response regulator [Desulfobacterales bacterium]|nr:response regulator [Desulfobacterales bacterium]MBS3755115.1 response regulator [Desulfobacterales bacterium]
MSKKIMVIDDDPAVVEYLTTLFEDNGYETCSAKDALEGIDIAKQEKPDLITLDLEMPGEWGPRFYRKLTEDPALKNIPVVVISGLSGHQYAINKAVASISKPFDRDELLRVVKENIL